LTACIFRKFSCFFCFVEKKNKNGPEAREHQRTSENRATHQNASALGVPSFTFHNNHNNTSHQHAQKMASAKTPRQLFHYQRSVAQPNRTPLRPELVSKQHCYVYHISPSTGFHCKVMNPDPRCCKYHTSLERGFCYPEEAKQWLTGLLTSELNRTGEDVTSLYYISMSTHGDYQYMDHLERTAWIVAPPQGDAAAAAPQVIDISEERGSSTDTASVKVEHYTQ
jgi:hypothetical protein